MPRTLARTHTATRSQLAAALASAHRSYAAARWGTLTADDQQFCADRGYTSVLRDTGVAGLRFENQIKCLHAHCAHALAGGPNPIGTRVLEALARGEDAAAGLE